MTNTPVRVDEILRRPTQPEASGRGWRMRAGIAVAVVAVLFVIRSTAPAELALSDLVRDGVTLAISVVVESLPFVVLGIAISVSVQVWLPQRVMFALLPRRPGLRRAVLSLLGVLVPVCECGNVPLARGLIARGISVPEALTFLLAAPILNPITIIVTYQAFGFSDGILLWRVVGGFVIANAVGWLFSRHPQPDLLLTRKFAASCATDSSGAGRGTPAQALRLFVTESSAMLPALMIGAAVAGLIQVSVSRNVLLTLGQNPVWSVLSLMALAMVISICSTVDAFFILSFGSTFTAGAIVAFLTLGPMIDIKMLALLRTTFTSRTLVALTSLVILAAAVLGLVVNYVG